MTDKFYLIISGVTVTAIFCMAVTESFMFYLSIEGFQSSRILANSPPFWSVLYYSTFWVLNTFGYLLGAMAVYRIAQIFKLSRLFRGMVFLSLMLLMFGVMRAFSVAMAFGLLLGNYINVALTVEVIALVGLFLNTMFINIFAFTAWRESRKLKRLQEEQQKVIFEFIETINNQTSVRRISQEMRKGSFKPKPLNMDE